MKTSKFSKKTSKKKQTGNEKERAAKDYKAKKVPFQDEQQESDSDCNLGAQKKQHDCQWKATPYINKIFSTEVPDVEESDKYNEMTSKPSGSGVKKDKAHNSFGGVTREGKTNESLHSASTANKRTNIDKRNKDRLLFGSVRRSTAAKAEDSSEHRHIIRHRPTISVRIEPDCFVPKMRGGKKQENRPLKLPPPPKPRKIEEPSTKTIQLPMSIISERHQDQIFTPVLPPEQLCRFGEVYEANLFQLIHKYLEVDTFHRVVYIGQETGSLATQLEDYFCLTNPIRSVFPGKVDYKDIAEKNKLLGFKITHVGAEEFFARASEDPTYKRAPFDRVIIHDAVQFFTDLNVTLRNIMKTLDEFGKILIIHRPGNLNTLPYFAGAKQRFADNDTPYMNIISGLQKLGADVEWDLVHVPIVMPTAKWLAMLKSKFPAQMEIMSNYEIACGLRELSEGPLKYLHGDNMEIEDRLMFITASHATFDCAFPAVQRVGGASQVPYSGLAEVQYRLKLTKDLEQFLPEKTSSKYKLKSLF